MVPPYPAAVPGFYQPRINVMRGYWMVSGADSATGRWPRGGRRDRAGFFDELVRRCRRAR